MVKHNNIIPNVHLRKHWQKRVRVHLDQASKKSVRAGKRADKSKACFPRPLQKLRPVVSSCTRKYAGKVRYGRGFTLTEIKASGLSARFARTVGISVDHRRTSTSEEQLQLNVARLNQYKSKLILFPRKEGKVKKGLINDSTTDQVRSAAAGNQVAGKVLPRVVAAAGEDEFAAITAADKEFRAHGTARNARTNKRYAGRREKKAAEAAAKKADK
jgi:large subunit ribosomal protein L13e